VAYNSHGKRIRSENLAGQVTTTAWYDWFVTYNGENRPILWENVSTNSHTPNSSTPTLISMSYDRMGRRVTKNDQSFVYNGYLQIANFELQTSDIKLQAFIWDPTEPVATRPLVWNSSTFQPFNLSTSYYTHDGNKNVSEVVTADGGVGAHYEYTPFGALIVESSASSMVNPWRFSSEYSDDMLGLVYYNYRHYEPIMGCWLRRDTLEAATGNINLYQIALSNLIDNFDLLGQTGCKCGPEVGDFLEKTLKRVEDKYNELRKKSLLKAWWICTGIHLTGTWEIEFPLAPHGCAQGECADTVSVHGQCYDKWEVNYILFGKISKLCDICRIQMEAMIAAHKIVMKTIIQTVTSEKYEWEYTHGVREWARIGRDMNEKLPQPIPDVDEKYRSCKPCDKKLGGYRNGFSTTWP
jgi:RHS repeat-associated protein